MGYELVRMMNKRRIPRPEKTVWKALGDHASDFTGRGAFPSQRTIARETGYSERHVQRILRKLEERGAIVEVKKPGRRTSREYRIVINPPVVVDEASPDILSDLEIKTGHFDNQDRTSCHQDRTSEAFKTGQDVHLTLIEPLKLTPQQANASDARARETRGVDKTSESESSLNDNEATPEITNAEAIRQREARRREIREQALTIDRPNGVSKVNSPKGKYR